jgi:hypothetical protein
MTNHSNVVVISAQDSVLDSQNTVAGCGLLF